mmetsp:Transcript_58470/g.155583  ORF Transcript_58470/g.155583 Transcript_58470/m.155583 type:complete len:392 (+) Transcript_58470:1164-2339(+)
MCHPLSSLSFLPFSILSFPILSFFLLPLPLLPLPEMPFSLLSFSLQAFPFLSIAFLPFPFLCLAYLSFAFLPLAFLSLAHLPFAVLALAILSLALLAFALPFFFLALSTFHFLPLPVQTLLRLTLLCSSTLPCLEFLPFLRLAVAFLTFALLPLTFQTFPVFSLTFLAFFFLPFPFLDLVRLQILSPLINLWRMLFDEMNSLLHGKIIGLNRLLNGLAGNRNRQSLALPAPEPSSENCDALPRIALLAIPICALRRTVSRILAGEDHEWLACQLLTELWYLVHEGHLAEFVHRRKVKRRLDQSSSAVIVTEVDQDGSLHLQLVIDLLWFQMLHTSRGGHSGGQIRWRVVAQLDVDSRWCGELLLLLLLLRLWRLLQLLLLLLLQQCLCPRW